MAVQTIVKDPERVRNIEDLEDILTRINLYEKERDCKAGVLLIQRMQSGGLYKIKSEEEAKAYLQKPVLNDMSTCEWGVEFLPHSYVEGLRKKFVPH